MREVSFISLTRRTFMENLIKEFSYIDHLIAKKNDIMSAMTANKILLRVTSTQKPDGVFQVVGMRTTQGMMERKILNKDKAKELEQIIATDQLALNAVNEMLKEEIIKRDTK